VGQAAGLAGLDVVLWVSPLPLFHVSVVPAVTVAVAGLNNRPSTMQIWVALGVQLFEGPPLSSPQAAATKLLASSTETLNRI
jgi:hypothetical protein